MQNPSDLDQKSSNLTAAVVYASHSGNAELVAEAICDGLCSKGIDSNIYRAEKADVNEVIKNKLIVLVCSTYDVGLLNDKMIKFNAELRKLHLPENQIEVVGLGDSTNYDIFCGAADILEESVKLTGAKKLMDTIRLDGPPHNKLQEMKTWAEALANKIMS